MNSFFLKYKTDLFFYSLLLFAFALPLYPIILPAIIVLIIFSRLLLPSPKIPLASLKYNWQILLPVMFYISYLASIVYSANRSFAYLDYEIKFSLILFPFLLTVLEKQNKEFFRKLFFAFIYGCAVSMAICIAFAVYRFVNEKMDIAKGLPNGDYGINFFLSSRLSLFIHPSYLAMYLNFALLALFSYRHSYLPLEKQKNIFLFLFISFGIILLASKAGLIILILQWICFTTIYLKETRNYILGAISTGLISLVFVFLYFSAPEFALKIKHVSAVFETNKIDSTTTESSAERVLVWGCAKELIFENPLSGVGAGDIKDELLAKYAKKGYTGVLDRKLNAHNQFLQTGVALGIPSMILCIVMCFYPLLFFIKNKFLLGIFFSLSIIINFMFESMLETQSGVLFFAFWSMVLTYRPNSE